MWGLELRRRPVADCIHQAGQLRRCHSAWRNYMVLLTPRPVPLHQSIKAVFRPTCALPDADVSIAINMPIVSALIDLTGMPGSSSSGSAHHFQHGEQICDRVFHPPPPSGLRWPAAARARPAASTCPPGLHALPARPGCRHCCGWRAPVPTRRERRLRARMSGCHVRRRW